MIDLSVPSDTLGLFNFKQFVKKDGKNTFKYIFFDNYDYIINLHDKGKLRDVSFDNVQKTILCSSIHLGYDLFVCPNCGNETIVAHTCSSRYCTKCGSKSSQRRAAYVSSMAFKSKHRHIVFTIPAQLRFYFIKTDHCLMVFLSLPEILWLPFSTTENIADKSVLKKRKVSSIIKKAINLNIFTKIQLIM